MSFVYPAFLFALFAIAIPVIIHLFNFRKFKKIYFTNVRFLKEVKQETHSRSRLKHLLVLFSRILAISFLVFAFSQPYIPSGVQKQPGAQQTVSIFIDNSFSMDAVNDNGRLFEQAKQTALEIANAFQPTDRFQLLTNDFEARHQRLVNREEVIEQIDETEISSSTKNISEIIARQKDAMMSSETPSSQKTFFIVSDFQKTISDFGSIAMDTDIVVKLIPLQSQQRNNLYIDSCWFDSPVRKLNQPDELRVRIVNKSENNYENIPLKFSINGQIRSMGMSFSVPPYSHIDTLLNFTSTAAGWQNAVIEITDYPVTFDDKFFVSYFIAENIKVLCINERDSNAYLQSLFGRESFFSFKNSFLKNIDYSSFPQNNLIILSQLDSISSGLAMELKKFTSTGGSLLVFPSEKINYGSYKEFFLQMNMNYYESLDTAFTKVSNINLEHAVYENVFNPAAGFEKNKIPENMDLPVVHKHYSLSKLTHTNEEWLMTMRNGKNFLARYSYGNGFVYLSASPLNTDFSNFPQHAIFVPTLFQISLHSRKTGKLFYTIGKDNAIEISNVYSQTAGSENMYHIVSANKTVDFIPEHKISNAHVNLFFHNMIAQAGNYFVEKNAETVTCVSFNYDRKESDISVLFPNEIEDALQKAGLKNFSLIDSDAKLISKKLGEISEGVKLWKYCIIFALLFLVTEVALLRWWK